MENPQLDYADFDILLEALRFWDSHHEGGSSVGAMFRIMMESDNADQYSAKVDQLKAKIDERHKEKKEQSILLQAKLVQMRHQLILKEESDECPNS